MHIIHRASQTLLHTCCLRFLFARNKLHARTVFRLT
jgi:hypothetical protein